jgi:tryptophan 2,3-dioxygenase
VTAVAPSDHDPSGSVRPLEESIRTDLGGAMTYAAYLDLDRLLGAQHPRSRPEHHDELLFIVQHQTSELWLKLVLHELRAACRHLAGDEPAPALKCLARVKNVERTLIEQWSVLATLTPREYAQFRGALGNASGFQSHQYRAVEFVLGNKHPGMLAVFAGEPVARELLEELIAAPTVYEACESLVDVEDNWQLWRFRHLRTVQRTIGAKTGTGGSSGVGFLRRALDLTFFPELYAVRTVIGTAGGDPRGGSERGDDGSRT